ncbi:MAG: hypothetical protein ACR2OD_08720, partial [Gaiellaceae bacterium]
LWRLRLERGDPGQIPTVEEARDYEYSPVEQARMTELSSRFVVGNPESAARQLRALVDRFGADELFVVTICHDQSARMRSYELLAEAFGLPGAAG